MKRYVVIAALVAPAMLGWPAQGTIASPTGPVLLLRPSQVHSGGTLYLSGAGFPPRARLYAKTNCGPSAALAQRTDAAGRFVAARFRAPADTSERYQRCSVQVYAVGSTRVGQASFAQLPTTKPLVRCATSMCVHVRGALVRLKNYTQGNVVISGWPGAVVDVTVYGPSVATKHRRIHLGWDGGGKLRLTVAPGVQKAQNAHIMVHAHLGSVTGTAQGGFFLIPGGR
jgi:hypothetical protein